MLVVNARGRLYAIHITREANVHQHQIGVIASSQFQRTLSTGGQTGTFEASVLEGLLAIHRDEILIFDDLNAAVMGHHTHCCAAARCGVRSSVKRSSTSSSVKGLRRNAACRSGRGISST